MGSLTVFCSIAERCDTVSISSGGKMQRILMRTLGVCGAISFSSPNLIPLFRSFVIVFAGDFRGVEKTGDISSDLKVLTGP